jgi:hypothetical protein
MVVINDDVNESSAKRSRRQLLPTPAGVGVREVSDGDGEENAVGKGGLGCWGDPAIPFPQPN